MNETQVEAAIKPPTYREIAKAGYITTQFTAADMDDRYFYTGLDEDIILRAYFSL
jgi:hypothetical protein